MVSLRLLKVCPGKQQKTVLPWPPGSSAVSSFEYYSMVHEIC